MKRICKACGHSGIERGRATDGRRAYRCQRCGNIWTEGLQGRRPRWSPQRIGAQFANYRSVQKPFRPPVWP